MATLFQRNIQLTTLTPALQETKVKEHANSFCLKNYNWVPGWQQTNIIYIICVLFVGYVKMQ